MGHLSRRRSFAGTSTARWAAWRRDVASFARWLVSPETLPEAGADVPLSLREHFRRSVRWLFAADELPDPPASLRESRESGLFHWLLAPDRLPDPPPRDGPRESSVLAWLMRAERLDAGDAAARKGDRP